MSCGLVCPKIGQYACKNSECIEKEEFCDGTVDCEDESDEFQGCSCHRSGQFACRNGDCIARWVIVQIKAFLSLCNLHKTCVQSMIYSARPTVPPVVITILT